MRRSLGEFSTADNFRCVWEFPQRRDRGRFICYPRPLKSGLVHDTVVALQIATDDLIGKIPLWIPSEEGKLEARPIERTNGYDGRVGSSTSAAVAAAVIAALQLRREAGEEDPQSGVVVIAREYSSDEARTLVVAQYAEEAAAYLRDTYNRVEDLLAQSKANKEDQGQSVYTDPPPIPDSLRAHIKKQPKGLKLLATGSLAAAAGLLLFAGLGSRRSRKRAAHEGM